MQTKSVSRERLPSLHNDPILAEAGTVESLPILGEMVNDIAFLHVGCDVVNCNFPISGVMSFPPSPQDQVSPCTSIKHHALLCSLNFKTPF